MNNVHYEIKIGDENFYLLFHKAIYRPLIRQLILSDIHLGKASHFRKKGIALPPQSHLKDLDKLDYLLKKWQPLSVLILGDLFHSVYNKEWLWFKSLLITHHHVKFILVEGNHDILEDESYQLPNLVKTKKIEEDQLLFTHAPTEDPLKINICGHVHPGIRLSGIARQSITLPCFYFNKNHFILPAFGDLTGLHILEKEENAEYYLVTHETVVKM